jgi:hypothetical protein
MGLTTSTMEISGGKVSDFMADHLEKNADWCRRKLRGQANHATLEMDPAQRSAKPPAPLDAHTLFKAPKPPEGFAVPQQMLNAHLNGSAAGRHRAGEANTLWIGWRSLAESGTDTLPM